RHPGIANQLRIQGGDAFWLLGIAGGGSLPLQQTGCAVQITQSIDEGHKAVTRGQRACKADLLLAVRLVNLHAPVLGKALQQLNALPKHVVPGVVTRVAQLQVLTRCPLFKQNSCRILVTEQSGHRLLEAAPEQHGGPNISLLPAIHITVTVPPRAGQILRNLGVAVGHRATRTFSAAFPLDCGGTRSEFDNSPHWLVGAKPFKFTSEMPFLIVWLIVTTPVRPRNACSSNSSWLNMSGS